MFTGIIQAIIGTKFQINPLTVTLFSGSGPKAPPIAGEFSKLRAMIGKKCTFSINQYSCRLALEISGRDLSTLDA